MSTRWSITFVVLLALAGVAPAQDAVLPGKTPEPKLADAPAPNPGAEQDPAARHVMDRASDALRAARAISYDATFSVSGALTSAVPFRAARGSVSMLRLAPDGSPAPLELGGRWALRAHGKGDTARDKDIAFDISWINGQTEWLEPEKKTLKERADMEARGPAIMLPRTTMRVEGMISEPPFRGDLDHASLTLEAQDDVAGVRCDVVVLARGTGGRRQRWYIGADDGIPRRAVEVTSGTMGGELDITLSNVHVDVADPPAMSASDLHVPLPEGYHEDRVKGAAKPAPAPPHPAGSPAPAGPNATPEPPKAVPPAPPPPVMFPDAELDRAGGGKVNFADLHGGVFVVDFFGSWCIPAPAWHVHYNSLAARFASTGAKFFGVGVRERDNANLLNDAREPKREYTLLLGGDAVAQRLGLRVYPATVVVDKDGRVVEIVQGARGEDSAKAVSEAIRTALGLAPAGEKSETKDAEHPADKRADEQPREEKPIEQPADKPEEKPR